MGSGKSVILVSNRVADPHRSGPVSGGLASALVGAVRESGAIWVGGSGKLLGGAVGDLPIAMTALGKGKLALVDFPEAEYRKFYDGMANSVLWPVLHFRADLLRYQAEYFEAYQTINTLMAEAVTRVAPAGSVIWVHDYHYFMLGEALRRRGAPGPLGFFLHTSFPNRSILSCIPNHRELMRSLTAYDLIGFQTDEDLLRFRDYATAELFATVVGQTDLRFGERRVRLGVFPIGIDAERFAAAAAGAVATRPVQRLRQVLAGSRLVIGVDRLDYSKGLVRRFQAYQQFFALYPEERRRVSFLQITPPTRGKVEAYREMRTELAGIAGEMNAHLGDADWVPLRYINEGFSPEKLAGYYRLAKIGCVTPLRDGMNLVAKEYVACQDPEDPGVLVLSTFAGAARQMGAALLVNPYDPAAVASRLREALYMPLEERLERWSALMRTLKGTDLQAWFRSFIAILETPTVATAPFQARSVA